MVRAALSFAVPGLWIGSLAAAQPPTHPVEAADIVNLRQVKEPQISPDGKTIAYVIETPVGASEHRNAHIWLVVADGSAPEKPFLTGGLSDTSPRWSPDGKRIAFLSERPRASYGTSTFGFYFKITGAADRKDLLPDSDDKPVPQIWVVAVGGGEALPLTDVPGGVKSFQWSKDGARLAFIRKDQDTKDERDRKKAKADHVLVDRDYKFDRLWIYNLASHEAVPLSKDGVNVDDFDWSPDGTKLVARISPTGGWNDFWYVSKIVILNAASGQIEKTICDRGFWSHVRWSRKGDKISFAEQTEKGITGLPVIYDLTTGKTVRVDHSYPATIWEMEWNQSGTSLTAEGIQGTHAFFAKVDAASGQVQKLADVMAEGGDFSLSEDGEDIAYPGQTLDHPTEVWTLSSQGNQSRTQSNPQVKSWQLGKVQEVSWTSSKDKMLIHGLLVLPPNYREGERYNTIVQIHGGPLWGWWTGWLASWHEWAQLLASHGYVVLLPNPRGSDGADIAFAEANFRDWGGGDFQDVMDGVDMLVSGNIADPQKLGIGGWSYGGFMTSWAITHTDRFKAAVVGAAVTDLPGMSTTTDIAPAFLTDYFGDAFAQRKLYEDHSPISYISKCHTPALVLHGEADTRVPTFQGEEFYNGLRFLGRETQMVRYPREPHVFIERAHQQDLLERVLNWFDSHLAAQQSASLAAEKR